MADKKYKPKNTGKAEVKRVTPIRPSASSRTGAAAGTAGMPNLGESVKVRLKKNRSTLVIVGVILLIAIVWGIVRYNGNKEKFDIYALNTELNYDKINSEYIDFIKKVANINENMTAEKIADNFDEILQYNIPRELTNVKAAQVDFLVYKYRELTGEKVDEKDMNQARQRLSAEIAKIAK